MQKLFFGILFAAVQLHAYSQEKWEITPAKGISKGMGRLNLVFADSVEWSVDIYSSSNKFITNHSIMDRRNADDRKNYHEYTPGIYNFKLNTVLVENVPIEEGKETRLRTGVLDIITAGNWELRNETKQKFLTSGNKPKKIALPVGKYQLGEGNIYKMVEVIAVAQFNPKIMADDQYQYIISPVTDGTDSALATQGRLNFALISTSYGNMGYQIEFEVNIYNKEGDKVKDCGNVHPCVNDIYLPEGKYTIVITWGSDVGVVDNNSPIRLLNIPVRKGNETRVKLGYLENLTKGDFELLNEAKDLVYWQYISQGRHERPLPVGKYVVRVPGIGEFPIHIEDGKIESLNPLPSGSNNEKLEALAFRISPVFVKGIKPGMGRLNCNFPSADSVCFRLEIPKPNGGTPTISLDTVKSIDLLPGKYELKLHTLIIPFQIEKQKETSIIHGYMKTGLNNKFSDAVRGGSANIPSKTIPVRPGFYYIFDVEGHPYRQMLIKVSEGEIVDYKQYILVD